MIRFTITYPNSMSNLQAPPSHLMSSFVNDLSIAFTGSGPQLPEAEHPLVSATKAFQSCLHKILENRTLVDDQELHVPYDPTVNQDSNALKGDCRSDGDCRCLQEAVNRVVPRWQIRKFISPLKAYEELIHQLRANLSCNLAHEHVSFYHAN